MSIIITLHSSWLWCLEIHSTSKKFIFQQLYYFCLSLCAWLSHWSWRYSRVVFQKAREYYGTLVTTKYSSCFWSCTVFVFIEFDGAESWEARKCDSVLQPHAYLGFPPSHPSLISQCKNLSCHAWWFIGTPGISGLKDADWAHGKPALAQLTDVCVCTVNSVVICRLCVSQWSQGLLVRRQSF